MELISTHPVKKSDLGFHGNLFGGKLLAWVDAAGAAYASQVCDTPRMVTVLIDECVFKKPAKEGHLLKIYGDVKAIGKSSITLKVEARSHNVYDGRQAIILSTHIKFVRIDEQGEPIPISDRVKSRYSPDI
jgi:acyl-CoA thioesterase YciA